MYGKEMFVNEPWGPDAWEKQRKKQGQESACAQRQGAAWEHRVLCKKVPWRSRGAQRGSLKEIPVKEVGGLDGQGTGGTGAGRWTNWSGDTDLES